MSVITFPMTLRPSRFSWGLKRNVFSFSSPFGSQTQEVMSPWWTASMSLDPFPQTIAGPWKALFISLKGQQNQLALWDMSRSIPLGTLRGSPVVDTGGIGAGAQAFNVSSVTPGQTIKAGDYLGIGSGITQQVIMITQDAVADGSGLLTLTFQPPLRNAFPAGTAVIWDRPKALFRATSTDIIWNYETAILGGLTLSLIEDPRP